MTLVYKRHCLQRDRMLDFMLSHQEDQLHSVMIMLVITCKTYVFMHLYRALEVVFVHAYCTLMLIHKPVCECRSGLSLHNIRHLNVTVTLFRGWKMK